jgi:hypothetical protein
MLGAPISRTKLLLVRYTSELTAGVTDSSGVHSARRTTMKKTAWLAALLFTLLRFACWAQTFKIYPGAKLDEKSTSEATKSPMNKGSDVKVYVTPDAFERVRTFYASLYHETQGGNPPRVPNGPEIHWAFFTIDDAKNLWTSKYWVKVQRPYIGNRPGELMPNFNDARDETVIEVVQKK